MLFSWNCWYSFHDAFTRARRRAADGHSEVEIYIPSSAETLNGDI